MKFEQVLQLVDAVSVSSLTEFKYEEGGVKISMKKAPEGTAEPVSVLSHSLEPVVTTEPETAEIQAATAVKEAAPAGEEKEEEGGQVITSPLVGTFYAAPAEDAKPYVQVGDQVKKGQVLAIVEAMKLMNEITAEEDGVIAEICVTNGQVVEYGTELFRLRR